MKINNYAMFNKVLNVFFLVDSWNNLRRRKNTQNWNFKKVVALELSSTNKF